ncbi:MAG TPA: hypothetical protein VIJ14_05385, partial [Rhabdochlamydiaceae bacterium]
NLPPLADGMTLYLISRVTSSAIAAQVGSLAAGIGTWALFARRTSPLIGLAGAAFYTVYKAVFSIYQSAEYYSGPSLERAEQSFRDKFIFNFHKSLDANRSDYDFQLHAPTWRAALSKWNTPSIQQEVVELLERAQAIAFYRFHSLKEATKSWESNPQEQYRIMVEGYRNSYITPDDSFRSAILVMNNLYRFARAMGYYSVPPNDDKRYCLYSLVIEDNVEEEGLKFTQGTGLQGRMHAIYNETHDLIDPFLKHLFPSCLENVKDEHPIPGDKLYTNRDNPFKLWRS